MVLRPEDADASESPVVLFRSRISRQNSGRFEAAVIHITADQLAVMSNAERETLIGATYKVQRIAPGLPAWRCRKTAYTSGKNLTQAQLGILTRPGALEADPGR